MKLEGLTRPRRALLTNSWYRTTDSYDRWIVPRKKNLCNSVRESTKTACENHEQESLFVLITVFLRWFLPLPQLCQPRLTTPRSYCPQERCLLTPTLTSTMGTTVPRRRRRRRRRASCRSTHPALLFPPPRRPRRISVDPGYRTPRRRTPTSRRGRTTASCATRPRSSRGCAPPRAVVAALLLVRSRVAAPPRAIRPGGRRRRRPIDRSPPRACASSTLSPATRFATTAATPPRLPGRRCPTG